MLSFLNTTTDLVKVTSPYKVWSEKGKVMAKRENVIKIINFIKETNGNDFYVALLIYDILGIEKPNQKLCDVVDTLQDDVDSIYDYQLREDIKELINR